MNVTDHFLSLDTQIESLVFGNGSTFDAAGIADRIALGYATSTGTVTGSSGADSFEHRVGDGFYTIADLNGDASVTDVLTLPEHAIADVTFTQIGDDLRLDFESGEYIRILDQFDFGTPLVWKKFNSLMAL